MLQLNNIVNVGLYKKSSYVGEECNENVRYEIITPVTMDATMKSEKQHELFGNENVVV